MYEVRLGDCLAVMREMPDDSVDSVVTDPPYHLTSIVKRYGKTSIDGAGTNEVRAKGRTDALARLSRGFMGKEWDGGDLAFQPELWAEVLRVLKPGGHLLSFSGTRTYHRMACAIEDAGFEIRDQIGWTYGSGFPKSHDVSKGIEAKLLTGGSAPTNMRQRDMGDEYRPHELAGTEGYGVSRGGGIGKDTDRDYKSAPPVTTPEAKQWQGWGTALKPAWEPICLARKPLSEKSVAANVLRWGTGALNIDESRVPFAGEDDEKESKTKNQHADFGSGPMTNKVFGKFDKDRDNYDPPGRWPANLIHDGDAEVTDVLGSAARFFYCAKASKKDRGDGNDHPTVKPTDLMRYLCRLVTPRRGIVLDPFAGSGSTGLGALLGDFDFIGIEQDAGYAALAAKRIGALSTELGLDYV